MLSYMTGYSLLRAALVSIMATRKTLPRLSLVSSLPR